jgi:predicted transcriptional regulator
MESDIETIAEIEFSHVWNTLDQDTRKALIQVLRYDDSYDVEIATFDVDSIDRHFDSKKTKDLLTRAINTKFQKNEEISTQSTGITRDLQAKI